MKVVILSTDNTYYIRSVFSATKEDKTLKMADIKLSQEHFKNCYVDFPGGPMVKNSPANAGDMDLIPDRGRSHLLWIK